jgi:hypothetical protein
MPELDPAHHVFRHIKKSWMHGDFIDPAAFRLAQRDGQLESGLSVNWVEYFGQPSPQLAVAPLRAVLLAKGRSVGGESKFALLNVAAAKAAAAIYTPITIERDAQPDDPSHSLIAGYGAYNDQVAEELQKVVQATFPAKPGPETEIRAQAHENR